ncbi:MAG: hypothetical protein AAFQ41_02755 [Cyanobacteria bacterium J06623_7]
MESAENQPQSNSDIPEVNPSSPPSKIETIALLNASIDKLESTIRRLGEDSAQIPPTDSMDNLLTTAQELEAAVTAIEAKLVTPPAVEPEVTAPVNPPATVPDQATNQPPPVKTTVKAEVKSKSQLNTALIVAAVTAIAIAIVTVFWLWKPELVTKLLPSAQPVPQVAVDLDRATETLVESPTVNLDESAAPGTETPNIVRDISAMDFPTEIESVAEPIDDVVETIIPSELAAPGKPKNIKIKAIEPKLNFTPEQNLVATLDTKLAALTQIEESELVQNVKVNADRSLLVRVTDAWHELDEAEQINLGNELLQRSLSYSFGRLELKDGNDILVARSPIIGNSIILQNTEELES